MHIAGAPRIRWIERLPWRLGVRRQDRPHGNDGEPMLENLTDWATEIVERLGAFGVAVLVALESVFPPIPSEVVLGLAGYTVSRGESSLIIMIVAATIGSVVGAWTLYGFSAAVGPVRLRAIVIRYGSVDRFRGARTGTEPRRGSTVGPAPQCSSAGAFPLIRSLISIPAGFRRMPLTTFTLFTAIGSLVWNTLMIGAGYLLADQWERVLHVTEPFQTVVVVLIGAGIVALVIRKVVRTRRAEEAEEGRSPPASTPAASKRSSTSWSPRCRTGSRRRPKADRRTPVDQPAAPASRNSRLSSLISSRSRAAYSKRRSAEASFISLLECLDQTPEILWSEVVERIAHRRLTRPRPFRRSLPGTGAVSLDRPRRSARMSFTAFRMVVGTIPCSAL